MTAKGKEKADTPKEPTILEMLASKAAQDKALEEEKAYKTVKEVFEKYPKMADKVYNELTSKDKAEKPVADEPKSKGSTKSEK